MAKEKFEKKTLINAIGVLEYNASKARRELIIDGEVWDFESILDEMEGNIIDIKCAFDAEVKNEETTE